MSPRTPRTLPFVLSLFFLSAVSVSADAQTYSINGTVFQGLTSNTLAGVVVTVHNPSGTQVGSALSDGVGFYTVSSLPDGTYYVRAVPPASVNYVPALYTEPTDTNSGVCLNGLCDVTLGTPVVIAGSNAAGRDLRLLGGAVISGTVEYALGGQASGVTVKAYAVDGREAGSAVTGPLFSGAYTINRLPDGIYYVRTTDNGGGLINELFDDFVCLANCDVTTGSPVRVTNLNAATVNFQLEQGSAISGQVTDDAAAPLESVTVNIVDQAGNLVETATTSGAGTYSTKNLPAGTYYAYTSSRTTAGLNSKQPINEVYFTGGSILCTDSCAPLTGTPMTLNPPADQSGVNFQLSEGFDFNGTVRNAADNSPLPNVTVNVFSGSGALVSSGVSNAAGIWQSRAGLPAGTYYVATSNTQGFTDVVYVSGSPRKCAGPCTGSAAINGTPVTSTGVPNGSLNFPSFLLSREVSITGTVIKDPSGAADPVFDVLIEVFTGDGVLAATARSNVAGQYSISGLPDGVYFARARADGEADQIYSGYTCEGDCRATSGTPISVSAGFPAVADFELDSMGWISGTVEDEQGPTPLAGVTVRIYDGAGSLVGTGVTRADGWYSVGRLPFGSYYVRTFNTLGFIDELKGGQSCPGECTVTDADPVLLNNDFRYAYFTLAAGGRISGRVTNANGDGIADVTVNVFGPTGRRFATARTTVTGDYITGAGLPPGEYFASTANSLGYVNERFQGVNCGGDCQPGVGTPIVVAGTATTSGRDFQLDTGGRVEGFVKAAGGGAPLSGVVVKILEGNRVVATATTDVAGKYRTGAGLTAGRYVVQSANTHGFRDAISPEFTVTPGTTAAVPDLLLIIGFRISGLISDADSTLPIAGVTVQIFDRTGAMVASPISGPDGRYVTGAGLAAGTYYARTRNDRLYVDQRYSATVCPACNPLDGTPIVLAAGPAADTINFALGRSGGIAGRAKDVSLDPLSGVTVSIYDAAGRLVTSRTTDATGNYAFAGLPPGNYFAATTNARGYLDLLYDDHPCAYASLCAVTTGTPIAVVGSLTTEDIDFVLTIGGRIAGEVAGSGSGPLAGAAVSIFDAAGRLVTTAIADSLGRYVTGRGLPPGTYFAIAEAPRHAPQRYSGAPCFQCVVTSGTPIVVTASTTTPGINFTLLRASEIWGTVTAEGLGMPLGNVEVLIFPAGGRTPVASARTDGSGQYRVRDGLGPGSYVAMTRNPIGRVDEIFDNVACASVPATCPAGVPITLPIGSESHSVAAGIDFALAPGARISGRVIDEVSGAGLANVTVLVWDSAGRLLDGAAAVTDLAGNFRSSAGLPAGTYFLSTRNTADYIDELFGGAVCVQSQCDVTRGTPVVSPGATNGRDFTLARGGRLSGRVTGRSGVETPNPLPGVTVEVAGPTGLAIASLATDAAGNYQMNGGLAAGSYFVRTINGLGFADELYDDKPCVGCAITSGTPVDVAVGSIATGVDFELQVGGLITGTIFDVVTGQPLADAPVSIFDHDGTAYRLVVRTRTNADGVYAISLPPGIYWVQADAFDRYRVRAYRAPASDQAPAPGPPATPFRPLEDGDYCPRSLCNFDVYSSLSVGTGDWMKRIDVGLTPCSTPITIGPSTLLLGLVGSAVDFQLNPAGGLAPYGFNVMSGQLPPGVTLDTLTGRISGTLLAAGSTSFMVTATDSLGCSGSVTFNPTVCGLQLSSTGVSVSAAAGQGIVGLAGVAAPGCDTSFTAGTSDSWLDVSPESGVAPATIAYSYQARGNFSQPRDGTITIAGSPFTVHQSGVAPTLSLSATGASVGAAGGGGSVTVISSTLDAVWTASSDSAWAIVLTPGGTGTGVVNFTAQRNPTTAQRVATLVIAGNTFIVTQAPNGPPGAPVGLTAAVSNFTATFSWQPAPTGGDATSWVFEAGLAPGTTLVSQNTTVPGYQVPGVPQGRYFIRVKGRNEFGTGPASAEYELIVGPDGGQPPRPPHNVTASMSGALLTMTWDAAATGGQPTGYILEAGTAVGLSNIATMTLGAARTFTYNGVPNGFYFLRVRARNSSGTSDPSDELLLNVGGVAQPPHPPQNLEATAVGSTVTLSWSPPAGGAAGGYVIEAGTARGLSNIATVNWTLTSAQFSAVPRGVYFIRVRGRNALGLGLASNEVMLVVP